MIQIEPQSCPNHRCWAKREVKFVITISGSRRLGAPASFLYYNVTTAKITICPNQTFSSASIRDPYEAHLLKHTQNMSTESSSGKFAPKQAVQLNPPKDDPISVEYLAKCDGML